MTAPHDALLVIATLGIFDVVLAIVLLALPVATCPECAHCARLRVDAAAARLLAAHKAFHGPGPTRDPNCPHCDDLKREKP